MHLIIGVSCPSPRVANHFTLFGWQVSRSWRMWFRSGFGLWNSVPSSFRWRFHSSDIKIEGSDSIGAVGPSSSDDWVSLWWLSVAFGTGPLVVRLAADFSLANHRKWRTRWLKRRKNRVWKRNIYELKLQQWQDIRYAFLFNSILLGLSERRINHKKSGNISCSRYLKCAGARGNTSQMCQGIIRAQSWDRTHNP